MVAGSAAIGQTTAQTTVNQASQRAAITWQSFDVGSQHTVQFNQPNASAVTLNSVTGPDPSQIAGRIVANGNIIITNPAGVAFSRGAQVDVHGLIVSAPGISTQNFMSGNLVFDQAPKPGAAVTNAGTITVKQAGLAALVAPQVANSGVINARLGHVVLAGAEAHTIDLYGDGLVSIDVTKAVTQVPAGTALVTNTGSVIADGGSVQITARAADGIVQDLVRAGGTIRANTVGGRTGRIEIVGVGGSVRVEGRVAADGGAGAGGSVAVRASDSVTVASGATISASGRGGGGTVALGTTIDRARAGRQAALSNGASAGTPAGTARRVVVESGATVSADGRGTGSGGTVTTLSTQSTEIDGLLTTRGGSAGGAGGVIEASSAGVLALNTAPNAGRGGTLYLDPYDLIIGTGTPQATLSGSASNPTIPLDSATSGTSYIAPATLAAAAQNGAVTISLNADQDLTVQQAVSITSGTGSGGTGGASLYLHAGHDLTVLANITIGASGSGKTLTLDAGHEIFIGPASGSPAVTLTVDGTITIKTVGSFSGDPSGSAITVHDNAVITSNAAISLEASNRVDIGSNVQMTAGPNPGAVYNPTDGVYTGIVVQTGSDITVGANTTLSAVGRPNFYTPAVILDAGGSVTVATNSSLNAGGAAGTISILAGSSTELTANGNANAPAVNASGTVSVGGGTTVGGAGSITIASGSSGQVILDAASLIQTTSNGSVQISSGTGGTALNGIVDGGSVQLNSSGAVQQSASSAIIASTLDGTAAVFDLIGSGNNIVAIGASFGDALSATGGNITIVDSMPLTVGSTSGSPGGGIQVAGGNTITLVTDQLKIGAGAIAATESEGFNPYSLYAPGGAIVIQPYTTGQPVELVNGAQTPNTLSVSQDELGNVFADRLQLGSSQAGTLTVRGTLDLGAITQLDLVSSGQISQPGGGSITVATLTANGASVDLTGGANQIGTLNASSASAGDFRLDNGTTPLTLTNALTASGQVSLTLDSLTFCSCASITATTLQLTPYSAGRSIDLVAGPQTAGRLSVDQAMIDAVEVQTLILGGNGQGGLVIGNAGDSIDLTGHVGTLNLVGPGAVTEGSGAGLRVATLEISTLSDGPQTSGVALNGPNQIGVLTAQSAGDISLTNVQTLRVDVASTPGNVSITTSAGDLYVARTSSSFDGTAAGVSGAVVALSASGNLLFEAGSHPENVVQATTSLALNAGGAITQDSGTIVTPVLTGYAAGASLAQAGNQVITLGSFISSGDFTLSDSVPLTVGGVVAVGTGQTLSLASNSVQIGGEGALSAPGGIVALAPLTAGDPLSLTSVPSSGIVAETLRLGSSTTGDVTLTGTFELGNVGTLDLESAGNISQDPNGVLQVGTLTGRANSMTLTGANEIGELGTISVVGLNLPPGVSSAFRLRDDQSLTVIGNLTATVNNVVIDTSFTASADVTVATPISTPGGDFVVYSGHSVTVASGATISAPNGGIFLEAAFDQNDPVASGSVQVNAALSANSVFIGAGPGGIALAANVTGLNTVTLRGEANTDASLIDLYRGPITQSAGAITTAQLSARGTSVTLDGDNQIAAIATSAATTGAFSLATGATLSVNGLVSVSSAQLITIASTGIQFSGGGFSAPGGSIALTPFATGGGLAVGGTAAPGAVAANTLQIGNTSAGPISIVGTLSFDQVGTVELQSAQSITQPGASVITAGTLTVQAGSASLDGRNQIGRLDGFTIGGALALRDASSLSVFGPGSVGSVTITSLGSVAFSGTLTSAGGLTVDASGTVSQSSGSLTAATLSGTAVGTAQFGVGGTANFASLGGFAVSASPASAFNLRNAAAVSITGPVSAGTLTITAPQSIQLQNGQLSADTATIAVTPAAGAIATLSQTGTTVVTPFSRASGSLLLSLPGSGSMTLQQLNAPNVNLQLTLGIGSASGAINGASLLVSGNAGSATLTGTVAGQGGGTAASISSISPSVSTAYTLNGCTIAAATCGVVMGSAPGFLVPTPPPIAGAIATPTPIDDDGVVALFTPKSFLDTELGNTFKTDLLSVDLITIGIVRDPADTELLLPNISDRDY